MTLIVKPGFNGMTDADAIAYVNAVEAADGQLLEFGVGKAINDFVVGCKLDGIWSAIKASCILSGARTLAGALIPLAGTAPTNVGPFVSGDYNRKTGLVGNGSTKYLDSNRNNNADPQNNKHLACYLSTSLATNTAAMGALTSNDFSQLINSSGAINLTINSNLGAPVSSSSNALGLIGASRPSASVLNLRALQANYLSISNISVPPASLDIAVFARNFEGVVGLHTSARLAFYSIGESLNLAALDARVTALITAFGVAIP